MDSLPGKQERTASGVPATLAERHSKVVKKTFLHVQDVQRRGVGRSLSTSDSSCCSTSSETDSSASSEKAEGVQASSSSKEIQEESDNSLQSKLVRSQSCNSLQSSQKTRDISTGDTFPRTAPFEGGLSGINAHSDRMSHGYVPPNQHLPYWSAGATMHDIGQCKCSCKDCTFALGWRIDPCADPSIYEDWGGPFTVCRSQRATLEIGYTAEALEQGDAVVASSIQVTHPGNKLVWLPQWRPETTLSHRGERRGEHVEHACQGPCGFHSAGNRCRNGANCGWCHHEIHAFNVWKKKNARRKKRKPRPAS